MVSYLIKLLILLDDTLFYLHNKQKVNNNRTIIIINAIFNMGGYCHII